jgi:hypothetical protein
VNLLEEKTDTIQKITETLTDASKEVDLEVKALKKLSACYCLVTRMQGKIMT